MPEQSSSNPLALASLAMGLASILCSCCSYGFPFNMLGIVLGVLAIVQANQNPSLGGKAFAYAGIALSALSFLLIVGMMVAGFSIGMLGAILENANY